ncbi:hypothetical protein [Zooshikella harenae]|uniref:Peptidase M3A/M3B catalytic domain-containing protein n=1 Tax=Zooshikella harenae TaxID=2827238 RepID=A0ABS5ZGT5_9GAMM|nr:hypothetical protein [Zooshikella harenae]MBU2713259.1 hypothetical protein [Zooshikella harenae]
MLSFLKKIDFEYKNFNRDLAREFYLFSTARLISVCDYSKIYKKYSFLHTQETFDKINYLFHKYPENYKIQRYFSVILDLNIENKLCNLYDELDNLKEQIKIPKDDFHDDENSCYIHIEDVAYLLKNEQDPSKRKALFERSNNAYYEKISKKFIDLLINVNNVYYSLGYNSLIDLHCSAKEKNLIIFKQKSEFILKATDNSYSKSIKKFYEKQTNQSFTHASQYDSLFIFNTSEKSLGKAKQCFQSNKLLPLISKTLENMGLDFKKISSEVEFDSINHFNKYIDTSFKYNKKIILDMKMRKGKHSRAYVMPSIIPFEIFFSASISGGPDDCKKLLHEAGHALHYAYTSPKLYSVKTIMGNKSVTEAYAFLFERLSRNNHWLTNYVGLSSEDAKYVISQGSLYNLYLLRRYSSKLLFEYQLFSRKINSEQDILNIEELYKELLTKGTHFKYEKKSWIQDLDSNFYVANYISAWILEAQLTEYLSNNFGDEKYNGENWYCNPRSGEFLKNLWSNGNITADQLSAHIGYNDPTDISSLIHALDLR